MRYLGILVALVVVFTGAFSLAPHTSREARAAERLLESVRKPVAHRPRPFQRPEIPDA